MRLLLASKSPRRRQLLSELGWEVVPVDVDVDEKIDCAIPAASVAEVLARRKAAAWSKENIREADVLVAADTVVVHAGVVLGKPKNCAEATAMLNVLSGEKHTVYTGVCLRSVENEVSFTEATDVYFRNLTDEDIRYYIEHYQPFDKAGSYGIQEWIGMVGVSRIEGCYYNVMGLPTAKLYGILSSKFSSR